MALLDAGYWQTTYWSSRYWTADYWPEYGAGDPPPTPTPSGTMRGSPVPTPTFSIYLVKLLRDYFRDSKDLTRLQLIKDYLDKLN